MTETVSLTVDGAEVEIEAGATLLDAVRRAGRDVPTLCYWEHTTPPGLCRLCVVEVEGWPGLVAACVSTATKGAAVRTRSPAIDRARRTMLEMLASTVDLSDAPEVLEWMEEYEAVPARMRALNGRKQDKIDDNPVFLRDYTKCVMCWRCVQVCGEDAQYNFAIHYGGRGFDSRIVTFYEKGLPETPCVFCGQCVGACPTGALVGKREVLLEQGHSPAEVLEMTRVQGEGKRSRIGPHLDGGLDASGRSSD